MVKVGIPRALLYYKYYPLWKAFLEELGTEVVLSRPTDKELLKAGINRAADETCLPVKLFYGHVLDLKDRVDYLFIPRLISIEKKAYTCPKFLGLPDLVRAGIDKLPPIIDTEVNLKKGRIGFYRAVCKTGRIFTRNLLKIYLASRKLLKGFLSDQRIFNPETEKPSLKDKNGTPLSSPTIAVVGHGYNIYDSYVSKNLLERLRSLGAKVITSQMLPKKLIRKELAKLSKNIFWSYEKELLGATLHFLESKKVDGIIQVVTFACGPDSLIAEVALREAKRKGNVPYMQLVLDEHLAEIGVVTRLEAFMDMLAKR